MLKLIYMTKKQSIIKTLKYIYVLSSFTILSTPQEVEALITGNIPFLAQSLLTQSEPDELLKDAIRNIYDCNIQHLQDLVNQLDFSAPHINLLTHVNKCIPQPLYRDLPHPSVISECITKAILTPDDRENIRKLNYYLGCIIISNQTDESLINFFKGMTESDLLKLISETNHNGAVFVASWRPDILIKNINMFFDALLYGPYHINYSVLVRLYFNKTHMSEIDNMLNDKIKNLSSSQIDRLALLLDIDTMDKIRTLRVGYNSNARTANSKEYSSRTENNNNKYVAIDISEEIKITPYNNLSDDDFEDIQPIDPAIHINTHQYNRYVGNASQNTQNNRYQQSNSIEESICLSKPSTNTLPECSEYSSDTYQNTQNSRYKKSRMLDDDA